MKHKVSELEGALLDAAVAKAEGIPVRFDVAHDLCVCYEGGDETGLKERRGPLFNPSGEWKQGGPIIEREKISLHLPGDPLRDVVAYVRAEFMSDEVTGYDAAETGPNPLVAAMRAYVASKFGEEVEL